MDVSIAPRMQSVIDLALRASPRRLGATRLSSPLRRYAHLLHNFGRYAPLLALLALRARVGFLLIAHCTYQLHCKILHRKIKNKDEGTEKIAQRPFLFFSMRATKQVSDFFSPFLHLDPQFCDTSFFGQSLAMFGRCVFRSF